MYEQQQQRRDTPFLSNYKADSEYGLLTIPFLKFKKNMVSLKFTFAPRVGPKISILSPTKKFILLRLIEKSILWTYRLFYLDFYLYATTEFFSVIVSLIFQSQPWLLFGLGYISEIQKNKSNNQPIATTNVEKFIIHGLFIDKSNLTNTVSIFSNLIRLLWFCK